MQLENAVPSPTPTDSTPAQQAVLAEPVAKMEAPELVPNRHVVRVWNSDTGKAVEVKRGIDTGNTLDLWI